MEGYICYDSSWESVCQTVSAVDKCEVQRRRDARYHCLISLVLTCTLAYGSTCWILARSASHRCSGQISSASTRVCKRKAKLVWLLAPSRVCVFACQTAGSSTGGTSAEAEKGTARHCKTGGSGRCAA
jgi:hypothetical protein